MCTVATGADLMLVVLVFGTPLAFLPLAAALALWRRGTRRRLWLAVAASGAGLVLSLLLAGSTSAPATPNAAFRERLFMLLPALHAVSLAAWLALLWRDGRAWRGVGLVAASLGVLVLLSFAGHAYATRLEDCRLAMGVP